MTLHYITLHYITLHYITLHYITLHYIITLHYYIIIYLFYFTLSLSVSCACRDHQVSRCGMIYMEPESLGWRPIFKSWLAEMPATMTDKYKRIITDMFERFVDPLLALVRKRIKVGATRASADDCSSSLCQMVQYGKAVLVESLGLG